MKARTKILSVLQMKPQDILNRVADTYRTVRTYRDEGIVIHGSDVQQFKSYFKQPNKFRYQYLDSDDWVDKPGGIYRRQPIYGRSALWSDGEAIYRKRFFELHSTITDDLSRAKWMSTLDEPRNGLQTLFFLVDHAETTVALLALRDAEEKYGATSDGTKCFTLVGTLKSGHDVEAWISSDDFTLRRFRQKTCFRTMEDKGIAEGVPDNVGLPYSTDCVYTLVELNGELDDDLFTRPEDARIE